MKTSAYILIIAVVFLFACKRQATIDYGAPNPSDTTGKTDTTSNGDTTQPNNPPPPPPPPTSNLDAMRLLTQKDWKQTSRILNGTETFGFYKPCYKDDIFTFKPNGEYFEDEGPTKCSPNSKQTEKFSWYFLPDSTKFQLSAFTYTIHELTEIKLKVSFKSDNDVFQITYGH